MLAPFRSRRWIAYVAALLSVVAAWAARHVVDPILQDHASFSFFFLAVSIAAWTGGIWPATFAAVLSSLVGNYFFTHPLGSLQITTHEELVSLLLFIAVSLIIGVLSEISLRALERARIAERAKDELMATVAHELRSPLTVIRYANEVQRIERGTQSHDHLELIDRQVYQLNLLIQDLMDVSRVARGKIWLDRQQVDASAVVPGAIEKARPLIESREHKFTIDMSNEPMSISADPARLEQVLANLLTNAAKYTPNGGEIHLLIRPSEGSVVFTVRDNGFGISKEMLPRVFDLFAQADAHATRSGGGLGIGLALVKKLVELHGGSVRATSAGKNRGSEFVVSLPLEQPAPLRATPVKA